MFKCMLHVGSFGINFPNFIVQLLGKRVIYFYKFIYRKMINDSEYQGKF